MHQQNQIKRTLALADSIEVVRTLLQSQSHKNRASVSRAVCHHFNFHDARGRPQIGGCVKALRELERIGHFVLPAQSRLCRAQSSGGRGLKNPADQYADAAQPPERKSKPKKALIAMMTTLAVGFALLLFVFIRQALQGAAHGPGPLAGLKNGSDGSLGYTRAISM